MRHRLLAWVQSWRRAETPSDLLTLHRRKVYILPTRNGLLFSLVLLAMLLGAMNYGNSLAYALTFLLSSVTVVSILHTYRNLGGLTFRAGQCRPVFAGEAASFPIAIENADHAPRFAIELNTGPGTTTLDLPARSTTWSELRVDTSQRGWCELGRLTARTRFPLGLFQAWSYLYLRQRCLIYPRPESGLTLPVLSGNSGEDGSSGDGAEDFAAFRDYRAGDPLRHVHWKALAGGRGLVIKQFSGNRGHELWLSWDELGTLGVEGRLSRLCGWVMQAEQTGRRYGLVIPGTRIVPGNGSAHRHRCLEALALYGVAK